MDRDNAINVLIEYYIEYYFNVSPGELEDLFSGGFKGVNSYTDLELKEALDNIKKLFRKKQA